ncbi:coiled-coil domain-containing protein [Streptomyces niveus]|uniref:hypothetical protein n=1 Tax=Streptomyces niveus TaxID=193462 RepID=UPI0036A04EA8
MKLLKHEFSIDSQWDGRSLAAGLKIFEAPTGSGGTTGMKSACAAMGSLKSKLVGPALCTEGVRLTFQTASTTWLLTHDRRNDEVEFVDQTTGEKFDRRVRPEGGQESAGAHMVGLMGVPAEETARGCVTFDALWRLLHLNQVDAMTNVYGGAASNWDHKVTLEIALGLVDGAAARLKARSAQLTAELRTAQSRLKNLREKRRADGLATTLELDVRERELRSELSRLHAAGERLRTELNDVRTVAAQRQKEVVEAETREEAAIARAQTAGQALAPLSQALGAARARAEEAEKRLVEVTGCPECGQALPHRSDPDACRTCGQDAKRQDRLAQLRDGAERARHAAEAAERAMNQGKETARVAVTEQQEARRDVRHARSRIEAYRAEHESPKNAELGEIGAREREKKAELSAIDELRRELRDIEQLDQRVEQLSKAAAEAQGRWEAAEGESLLRRERVAKQLTQIFAPILMGMTDEVRSAEIDAASFTPRVNDQEVKDLVHCAGLVVLINVALHLTLFTAARTLPGVRLPAFQWFDSPLDGLGGGPEGDRNARAAMRAIAEAAAAAGEYGQIILTTPHPFPDVVAVPSIRTTVLDPHTRLYIPHLKKLTAP